MAGVRLRTIHGMTVLALLMMCKPASAIPPPMKPAELEQGSDLIGKVKVLAVACTGMTVHERTREKLPTYEAWLQIVSVKKGAVKANETVIVGWHDISKQLVGPWKVEYTPGEEVTTHLKWDAEQRVYNTTWWNAKGKPSKEVERIKMPVKPGQVIGLGGKTE